MQFVFTLQVPCLLLDGVRLLLLALVRVLADLIRLHHLQCISHLRTYERLVRVHMLGRVKPDVRLQLSVSLGFCTYISRTYTLFWRLNFVTSPDLLVIYPP